MSVPFFAAVNATVGVHERDYVMSSTIKTEQKKLKKKRRIFLLLGLFIIVLMIAAFVEGVAGREAVTLSVPCFFAVLFKYPGDSLSNVVSSLLCCCFLSQYF